MLIMGESCNLLIGGTCQIGTELNPTASGTEQNKEGQQQSQNTRERNQHQPHGMFSNVSHGALSYDGFFVSP